MKELIDKANRVLEEKKDTKEEAKERLSKRIEEAQNAIGENDTERQMAYLNLVIAIADMEK